MTEVVRTRAELRAALAQRPPAGRVRPDDGLAARRPHLADRAGARGERDGGRLDLRQPAPVRRDGDFTKYPRNEARDLAICEAAGVDIVFAPPVDEVYPPGFDTTVSVGAIAGPLEGAARPGHFDGVATVVAILFALVGAERAYFGLKDYQQVRVIRRMALDLALPTEVVALATVREPDGLAMSSRNARLSPAGRAAAPVIRRALLAGRGVRAGGERDAAGSRGDLGISRRSPRRARLRLGRGSGDARELATVGEPGRCCRPRCGSRACGSSTTSGSTRARLRVGPWWKPRRPGPGNVPATSLIRDPHRFLDRVRRSRSFLAT